MNNDNKKYDRPRSQPYQDTRIDYNKQPKLDLNGIDLVDVQAIQWAEYITDKGRGTLSTHQLRRFYSEVKNIERLSKSGGSDKWVDSLYPRIKLIVAKAVYNTKRQTNKIPPKFKEFLEVGIKPITNDPVTGLKSFEKFCLMFEAVVGYATQYTREER
jgi:CRISPR type III-A-associated protein Csm2